MDYLDNLRIYSSQSVWNSEQGFGFGSNMEVREIGKIKKSPIYELTCVKLIETYGEVYMVRPIKVFKF